MLVVMGGTNYLKRLKYVVMIYHRHFYHQRSCMRMCEIQFMYKKKIAIAC